MLHCAGTPALAGKAISKMSSPQKGPQFPTIDQLPSRNESVWCKLPLPSQKALDMVRTNLKSVRILDCAVDLDGRPYAGAYGYRGKRLTGNVVFESSDKELLREFTGYLRIHEEPANRQVDAYERGIPTIELTLADGKVIYFGFARGFIRWNAWRYDAYLMNPRGFALWLNTHGIKESLPQSQGVDYDHDNDYDRWEYEESKRAFATFVRTMPTSLRVFFRPTLSTRLLGSGSSKLILLSKNYEEIPEERLLRLAKAALAQQFPKLPDQIGALLAWDGKLTYSKLSLDFPIQLLLKEYEPTQVLTVVKSQSLSPAQWVAVSRYYSDWYFRRKFPSGFKPLDKALRARIIKGIKATKQNELDLEIFEEAMNNWSP